MKIDIYDQYQNVYLDNQTNDYVTLNIQSHRGETLDNTRYTLVHSASSSTITQATDLTPEEALIAVENFYNASKLNGVSYEDKIVKLNEGYAELSITFSDNKKLNRVIYSLE